MQELLHGLFVSIPETPALIPGRKLKALRSLSSPKKNTSKALSNAVGACVDRTRRSQESYTHVDNIEIAGTTTPETRALRKQHIVCARSFRPLVRDLERAATSAA